MSANIPEFHETAPASNDHYLWFCSWPETLPTALETRQLQDTPAMLASAWFAAVDMAMAEPRSEAARLVGSRQVRANVMQGVHEYFLQIAAPNVADGTPTIDQLRFVLDSLNPQYKDNSLVKPGTHIMLGYAANFLLNCPGLREEFTSRSTFDPDSRETIQIKRELPRADTRLIETMAEAELLEMYPSLPDTLERLQAARLAAQAKRAGVKKGRALRNIPLKTASVITYALNNS